MREWRSSRDYSLCTRSVSVRIIGKDKVMGNAVTIIADAVWTLTIRAFSHL